MFPSSRSKSAALVWSRLDTEKLNRSSHIRTVHVMMGVGVPIGRITITWAVLMCQSHRREWAKKANAHCGDEEGGTEKAGMAGETIQLAIH